MPMNLRTITKQMSTVNRNNHHKHILQLQCFQEGESKNKYVLFYLLFASTKLPQKYTSGNTFITPLKF